jgi:hypothetical protein
MAPPTNDPLARSLALYGALLATGTLIWNVRRDRRDRGSLRVRATVRINDFFPSTPSVPDEINFEVVNYGKRTAYVRQPIGIRTGGESLELPVFAEEGVSLPAKLEPGESFRFRTALARFPLDDMRRLGVVDTLGQQWFAPPDDFLTVQRRRLEYQKRPSELSWRTRLRARAPLWLRL